MRKDFRKIGWRESRELFKVARQIIASVTTDAELSQVREGLRLYSRGYKLFRGARYFEALSEFQQALILMRKAGNRVGEALVLRYVGELYYSLGRPEEAVAYLEQALPTLRNFGDVAAESGVLLCLGEAHARLDLLRQAADEFEQALSCGAGIPLAEGGACFGLGYVSSRERRFEEARQQFERALSIARKARSLRQECRCLGGLGIVHYELGRYGEAIRCCERALRGARKLRDRGGEVSLLSTLGESYHRLGHLEEATEYLAEAIAITETVRGEVLTEELRTSYFATLGRLYNTYVLVLLEQGEAERALHAAERGRARAFLELLTEAHAEVRVGVDDELWEEEQRLLGELQALHRQPTADPGGPDKRREQELEIAYQCNQAEIRRRNPRYAALTQPGAWGVDEIQAELVDAGTALLEYVLGEHGSFLFVVTRDDFAVFPLPPWTEIDMMARDLRDAVLDPGQPSYPHGYQLYEALVDREVDTDGGSRRVEDMIEGKRLLVVADGILHYLPFELLLTEQAPTGATSDFASLPYLVCRHAIVYAPSASVAGLLGRERGSRLPGEGLVAFADPVLPEVEADGRPVLLEAALEHVRGSDALTPLPHTRQEVAHIAALVEPEPEPGVREVEEGRCDRYDGGRVSLRLRGEATKEAVLARFDPESDPAPVGFAHFSTHGLLDEEKPQFSGLVLSPGDAGDPFWHTFEIFNARVPADLVVLSACETGLGRLVSGEGVVGLTRAFLYAGAGSVCVSLWKVPDLPTADFMETFYRRLLRGRGESGSPLDKAEALRQAQLETIELGGPTAHPFFWAPFVLVGEWRR